jgi:hypothetical protein
MYAEAFCTLEAHILPRTFSVRIAKNAERAANASICKGQDSEVVDMGCCLVLSAHHCERMWFIVLWRYKQPFSNPCHQSKTIAYTLPHSHPTTDRQPTGTKKC